MADPRRPEDPEAMAMDFAAAVNEEIRDLFAAGADVVKTPAEVGKAAKFVIVASSPREFAQLIRTEVERWKKVAQSAGIKAE